MWACHSDSASDKAQFGAFGPGPPSRNTPKKDHYSLKRKGKERTLLPHLRLVINFELVSI